MEAEVFDAKLLEELESVIDLGQGLVLRIGVLATPRTLGGAGAERINKLLVEGVPPSNAEAQPILHLLAGDDLVSIVIMESQTLMWSLFTADVWNLVDVPKSHGMLLCYWLTIRKLDCPNGFSPLT